MRMAAGGITVCSYYNSVFYYSRTMAVSGRRSMLISSGDSLRTLSSILSGEGLDEGEQRASPLVFSAVADTRKHDKRGKPALERRFGADAHTNLDTLCDGFGFDKVIWFALNSHLSGLRMERTNFVAQFTPQAARSSTLRQ
jgi:hypothetical protein